MTTRRRFFGLLGAAAVIAPLAVMAQSDPAVAETIPTAGSTLGGTLTTVSETGPLHPDAYTSLAQQYADLYQNGYVSWKEYREITGVGIEADQHVFTAWQDYQSWIDLPKALRNPGGHFTMKHDDKLVFVPYYHA